MIVKFFIERWQPIKGGAENSALRLKSALEEKGVEVSVLTRAWTPMPSSRDVERVKGSALMFYIKSFFKLFKKDYDVLHMHGICIFSGLLAVPAKLTGRKAIIKTTTEDDVKNVAEYKFGKMFLRLLTNIDAFVCTSKAQADEVRKYLPNVKIKMIPNGIDTSEWKI